MSSAFLAAAFVLAGAGGASLLFGRPFQRSAQVLLAGAHLLLLTYLEVLAPARSTLLSLVLVVTAVALVIAFGGHRPQPPRKEP